VTKLCYQVPLDDLPAFRADAISGDSVFEVLIEPRDVRRLRVALMEMARVSSGYLERRGIILIDEPRMSEARLLSEWEGINTIFKKEILHRMALVIRRKGSPDRIVGKLTANELKSIDSVFEHVRLNSLQPLRRQTEAFLDILRALLVGWFRRTGPHAIKQLCEQTGFSYPTISIALEKLEPHLVRHSDRSVELRSFPRDAWFKLVAQAERVRSSKSYSDRSGRPRSSEVFVDRLRELRRDNIAVSGVLGARHYVPGLDLTGTPRLDLVLHANRRGESHHFLHAIDPALKPSERGEAPQVVIHTLFRPVSFFETDAKGRVWADEVECLLDLHEARLESQALEFLERLTSGSKA
jgi:hypothetical protein